MLAEKNERKVRYEDRLIKYGRNLGMICSTMKTSNIVTCFPIIEYWLDIGQLVDYEKAQSAVAAT